jgi:lambda repressor-like predicted transcriptional regulator
LPDGSCNYPATIRIVEPADERLPARPLLDKITTRAKARSKPLTELALECGISERTLRRWTAEETATVNMRSAEIVMARLGWNPQDIWG